MHIAGLPADLDAIYAIAAQHDLAVIEDAAHAFPTTLPGTHDRPCMRQPEHPIRHIAPCSTLVCFSFYATKTITTGEGGMICTDDDALAERCRIMALHGISKDAWKRYTAEGSWYYEIVAPGFKYNMTDIAAAMGLAQLAKAERMWRRRVEIAQRYNAGVSAAAAPCRCPTTAADCQHAWHLYMLRLNLDQSAHRPGPVHRGAEGAQHRHQRPLYPPASAPLLPGDLWLPAGGFPGRLPRIPARDLAAHLQQDGDQDVLDVINAVQSIVEVHQC